MKQVVDLQDDPKFQGLGVQLLNISPDPVSAWRTEGGKLGITAPMLSDAGNKVWFHYGIAAWMMPTNEPGHTFILIGRTGKVTWIQDYGAPSHGGVMYVLPSQLVPLIQLYLGGS